VSYTVRLLALAKGDRRRLFRYIDRRSPQGAAAWEAAYEACLDRLEDNPFQFGLAPEDPHFDIALRQFFFRTKSGKPYRVVFRIDGDVVTILRLRGHGQALIEGDELPDA
jgi:plasmid stabilization system protein ParE